MRRLRAQPGLRRMVRETNVSVDDLILPLFVRPGAGVERAIGSMPDVCQYSPDKAVEAAVRASDVGIPAVLLFGIPQSKDAHGSEAWREDGVVQRSIALIKKRAPELIVVTDVCLCEYTDHGHCGVLEGENVANDPTCELLAREAVSHARAGADVVAPSDMMDGRVGVIRAALDDNGFATVPILAYAAKFCSGFYGPFREAAESAPKFGDRSTYQMDPANADEALREVALDIEEGADIVMVKPALPYLDIIRRVKERFGRPVAAYQVSGEYAMIKAAAANGWIDEDRAMRESLTSIKRAGADLIITYYATKFAAAS
jgi:porphobilinogen synthase